MLIVRVAVDVGTSPAVAAEEVCALANKLGAVVQAKMGPGMSYAMQLIRDAYRLKRITD